MSFGGFSDIQRDSDRAYSRTFRLRRTGEDGGGKRYRNGLSGGRNRGGREEGNGKLREAEVQAEVQVEEPTLVEDAVDNSGDRDERSTDTRLRDSNVDVDNNNNDNDNDNDDNNNAQEPSQKLSEPEILQPEPQQHPRPPARQPGQGEGEGIPSGGPARQPSPENARTIKSAVAARIQGFEKAYDRPSPINRESEGRVRNPSIRSESGSFGRREHTRAEAEKLPEIVGRASESSMTSQL